MPPPDLVVLLCDTARADAFRPWAGPHPTPTVERLCAEGVSYGNATSAAPWTLPSIASILSGRLPTEHGISIDAVEWIEGVPASPNLAVSGFEGNWLPEELGARGYATWGASCNSWISSWGGFDRGFDLFLDLHDRTRLPHGRAGKWVRKALRLAGQVDHGGKRLVQEFQRRLAEQGPEPLFAFMNLMEVHSPFNPPPRYYPYPFWRRASTLRLSGASKGDRPFLMYSLGVAHAPEGYASSIRDLYYSCARYEDALLGAFVRAIEDRGRPTVVVMVSDHGENLGEHGLYGHNTSLAQTLLRVPLVVWGHKVEVGSGRVDDPVSLLCLPDWLTGLADGDGMPPEDGEVVVSEYESSARWIPPEVSRSIEENDVSVPALARHAGVAVREGGLKYVALDDGSESLFDLEEDPDEDHDLGDQRPDTVRRFLPHRQAWEDRRLRHPTYDGVGEVADREVAAHLRELGYID
jgi:arylsulfatase A-like enzyme